MAEAICYIINKDWHSTTINLLLERSVHDCRINQFVLIYSVMVTEDTSELFRVWLATPTASQQQKKIFFLTFGGHNKYFDTSTYTSTSTKDPSTTVPVLCMQVQVPVTSTTRLAGRAVCKHTKLPCPARWSYLCQRLSSWRINYAARQRTNPWWHAHRNVITCSQQVWNTS